MIKLVVFDLDNVIIDGEAIDEIGKLANVEEDIAEITEKAMQGEIDFETSIKASKIGRASCRERV